MEEQPRRRRRRRRGRRGGGAPVERRETTGGGVAVERPRGALPDWQWRTFPVFFAFVAGLVLMGLLWPLPIVSLVLFFGGLFGLAFSVAHVVTRMIAARRRR